jgi:DNA-binding winged helix-turn-helix (wHTH) protein/tetratricopeptide (TPR) repeat protein
LHATAPRWLTSRLPTDRFGNRIHSHVFGDTLMMDPKLPWIGYGLRMPDQQRFRLDDLVIDLDRQQVERAGARLEVSGLSFRLLSYLLEQGNRVVGFDELIESVWAPAVVGEETVTQRVKLLRQALGDDGRRPRYIRSVRGQGYQLCMAPSPVDAPRGEVLRRRNSRLAVVAGLAFLALAVIVTAFWRSQEQANLPDTALNAPGTVEAVIQRARYYAHIGQDANNERAIALFDDALALDADNADARIGLSRALSARMCLYNRGAGSVDRAEALARAVLEQNASDSRAHDALAYAFDCRGLIDSALLEYEQAFALDPLARFDSKASAAYLYSVKGRLSDALKANIDVVDRRSELHFLDIQIARNLELLGFTAEAERRYETSFRLYPDSVYSNAAWPRCLFLQGRLDEAEAAIKLALQRPVHPELLVLSGELALLRGKPGDAREAFARAHALRPHSSWPDSLARLHADGPLDMDWIGHQAERIREAIKAGEHSPDMFIELAVLELGLSHREAALDAIDSAIAAGFSDRAYLQVSPFFRALAGEPRLAAAIDRIGQHVAGERARVLAADWLPRDLLSSVKASP